MLPVLDRAITTLVKDLDERGLLDNILVIVAGEFGRSPIMTKTAGRDHWPIGGGQVIGSTDRRGGEIRDRRLRARKVEPLDELAVVLGDLVERET